MKEKLLNFLTVIFLTLFSLVIFYISNSSANQDQTNSQNSSKKFNKKFSGKTFVLDGDSLRVGGKEVRLFGVDAPEYSQTCFDGKKQEYECGQVSRGFLIKMVGGKDIVCFYASKDKYDRFLSKCYLGKTSVNNELLKNGMAIIYNFNDSDKKMIELEKYAKANKLGVWKGEFQLPKDYRKAHPRKK